MDIFLIKTPNGLMPAHESDREMLKKVKTGRAVRVKLTQVRNYEFLKKYFALLNLAYEYWEPPEGKASQLTRIAGISPEKNFERFRSDVAILAGYYTATYRLNGDVRLMAKSISFGSMSEDEFEELYTKTIDVIVKHVLKEYDGDTLRSILEQVEAFE